MWVEEVGSIPWLPGKRNAAEEQVRPGPTTRTLFVGREKTHSSRFSTMDAQCNSLPPSPCPSQAQKDAAGDEALPKSKPSCSPFIHLLQPVPSTLRFQALSTCRLQGRSCSYLLETAKMPWQGSSGCHQRSAVTCQIHPHRRQLLPPASPAAKAFVSTLNMSQTSQGDAEIGMTELRRDLERADVS